MAKDSDIDRTIRRHVLGGVLLAGLLIGGVGGWAVQTEFAGAVVGPGRLVVSSNLKKVQHPTGGVIGELRVRDGDRVRAGQILARLDQTVTRANLAIVEKDLTEQFARQARLQAERSDRTSIAFPDMLRSRVADPVVQEAVLGEGLSFKERRLAREGQKAQLRERIAQFKAQSAGLEQQLIAKDKELQYVDEELVGMRQLWRTHLVELGKLIPLERDEQRLAGDKGGLVAEIAQLKGKSVETQLQIDQVDEDMHSEVGKELSDVRAKIAELLERKVAAEDQLARVDIHAPLDGIVHQLSVHTVGGVVSAGEPLMMIVPAADTLEVETRINPQDIDQVRSGQKAFLRFPSFNQRTTPEIDGSVEYISADLTTDEKNGQSFYTARIAIPADAAEKLGGARLVPGMPVEAFVQTSQRTVLSYLTKPLMDQINLAFREGR